MEEIGAGFPWSPEAITRSARRDAMMRDALILRFANVMNTLQDEVFRLAAETEEARDVARLSRRDILDHMERFGVIEGADRFLDAAKVRNRLSHGYRDDPAAQAGLTNRVWAAAPIALRAVATAEAWARARGYIPA